MDVTVLTQLIGSLGFPIVACGALFWRMTKSDDMHKQEVDKLAQALNNNTEVLRELMGKLGEEDHE